MDTNYQELETEYLTMLLLSELDNLNYAYIITELVDRGELELIRVEELQ